MQTFHAETIVAKNGELHLEHLPFSEGDIVHVYVSSVKPIHPDQVKGLRGSVLNYDHAFAAASDFQ